jgi:hypothetical protein
MARPEIRVGQGAARTDTAPVVAGLVADEFERGDAQAAQRVKMGS